MRSSQSSAPSARAALNRLASSVSIAGLILGQSLTPAMAQNAFDILNGQTREGQHIGNSVTAGTANWTYRQLFEAHAQIRAQAQLANIRPLPFNGTYRDSDGRYRFLEVERHLDGYNGNIRGFVTQWNTRLYSENSHGRYEIISRICSDDPLVEINGITLPSPDYQYTIVTYMRALPLGLDRIEQVFNMASFHRPQTIGPYSEAIPSYFSPGNSRTPLVSDLGQEIAIPDCILDEFGGDWGGPYAALYTRMYPGQISTRGIRLLDVDERPGQCPPEEFPDQTIGTAVYHRDVFELFEPIIDTEGNNIFSGAANAAPWTYERGCRAPRVAETTVTQNCTRMIAGRENVASRAYVALKREIVPERGYYLPGEFSSYELLGTVDDWRLIVDLCAPNTTAPQMVETVTPVREDETGLTCPASHPLGTWDRRRDGTSTNFTLPGTDFEPWDLVVWDDWQTTRNDCHQTSTATSVESQTSGCQTSQRNVTTTTTSYHDGRAPVVNSSYGAWVYASNSCGGSGGSDTQSVDVNGDGVGDYRLGDSRIKDHPSYTIVNSDCGTCNGPSNGSSSGNNRPTGGGFWGGVRDFFDNVFGGGGSSGGSDGGGGGGCFTRGTLVTMADGSRKAIERIECGEHVMGGGEVVMTSSYRPQLMYRIGGVEVSGDHLIEAQDGWIAVEDHADAEFIGLSDDVIFNLGTENNIIVCSGLRFGDDLEAPADDIIAALLATHDEAAAAWMADDPKIEGHHA